MAETTFQIFKITDSEIISALQQIGKDFGGNEKIQLQCSFSDQHQQPLTGSLQNLLEDETFVEASSCNLAIFQNITADFQKLDRVSIIIVRGKGSDTATVRFQNDQSPIQVVKIVSLARKYLKAYERTESTDKLLGDELAEFYRKREQGLIKLEQIAQNLIEQNEQYRRTIDSEKESHKTKIESSLEEKKLTLESSYNKKLESLKKKESDLKELQSEIDDRQNKHARRQIRKDLKEALAKRSEEFSLTKSTVKKRLPIHILFILLITVSGLFVLNSFPLSFPTTQSAFSWYENLRLAVSTFSFAASIIFYIRWNDSWFRRHAEEEFRLKQLELDIDRASWVVEMALEWKDEKGSEISTNLIDKLTENLFAVNAVSGKVKHPTEDIATTIIKASSGLNLNIPGIGDIALDRRGIRNLNKKLGNQ